MIQWKENITIASHIDKVWELFSDQHIRRIMPEVEEHTLIERNETEAGAKHRQTYREGKRAETYIVETLVYEDLQDKKRKKIRFVLGNAFEITLSFTLHKLDPAHTQFVYEGQNIGVNFVGRAMLKLGSQKSNNQAVQDFLQRVEHEAMK